MAGVSRIASSGVAFALLFAAAPLRAQDFSDTVRVRFEAETEIDVTLYFEHRDPEHSLSVAGCRTPCTLEIQPDRYRILVAETERTLSGSRVIPLYGSQVLRVQPKTALDRYGGLSLAALGLAAVVGGGVLMTTAFASEEGECSEPGCSLDAGAMGGGVALLISGLVALPVGLVIFGQSYRPGIEPTR